MLNPLSYMKPGQSAIVRWLSDDRAISPRLMDLGFTPGAPVICTLSRNHGELSAFLVRNAQIALRREDADLILVETAETAKDPGGELH